MQESLTIKKLVLTRETIRELTDPDLRAVAGGVYAGPKPPPTGCENTGIICEFSERTCCYGG